jgi:hypothetical protein
MEELDSIKKILDPKTPIVWMKEILSSELWEEELFHGGDVPLPPGLQTTWNQLSHHLGNYHQIPDVTTREWRLALSSGNTECSGKCYYLSDDPVLSLRGTGDEDWVSNDLLNQPTPGGRALHLRGRTRFVSRRCRSR